MTLPGLMEPFPVEWQGQQGTLRGPNAEFVADAARACRPA